MPRLIFLLADFENFPVPPEVLVVAGVLLLAWLLMALIGALASAASQTQRPAEATTPEPRTATKTIRRLTYRTKNGRFHIAFSFEEIYGGWRIYIASELPYADFGRDDGLHATHRLPDGSRFYVCWTDPLRTIEDAKPVAKLWAEKTSRYLVKGTKF